MRPGRILRRSAAEARTIERVGPAAVNEDVGPLEESAEVGVPTRRVQVETRAPLAERHFWLKRRLLPTGRKRWLGWSEQLSGCR